MATRPRQEMPPPGGYSYENFNWRRTYPRTWFRAGPVIALYVFTLGYTYVQFGCDQGLRTKERCEDVDIFCAMQPFLKAERDRCYLKTLRKTRDMEAEIMKDVPGWQTATWYGEPIYFTLGERWFDYNDTEFLMHAADKPHAQTRLWSFHTEYALPSRFDFLSSERDKITARIH